MVTEEVGRDYNGGMTTVTLQSQPLPLDIYDEDDDDNDDINDDDDNGDDDDDDNGDDDDDDCDPPHLAGRRGRRGIQGG